MTAWLLPLPGGPETTVSGAVRALATTLAWASVSGSGDSTGSSIGLVRHRSRSP